MPAGEQIYNQISENIKLVFDLTSRIDERVKILIEQHNEVSQKIERLMERHENILSRISVLENKNGNGGLKEDIKELEQEFHDMEIKVSALKIQGDGQENKWKIAGDFIFKVVLALLGAFLAWKLSK